MSSSRISLTAAAAAARLSVNTGYVIEYAIQDETYRLAAVDNTYMLVWI